MTTYYKKLLNLYTSESREIINYLNDLSYLRFLLSKNVLDEHVFSWNLCDQNKCTNYTFNMARKSFLNINDKKYWTKNHKVNDEYFGISYSHYSSATLDEILESVSIDLQSRLIFDLDVFRGT